MKVEKKILAEALFQNKIPVNLMEEDRWLFQTHLQTKIHEVKIYAGKNVLLLPEHILIERFKIWRGELTNHYLDSKWYVFKRIVKAAMRRTKKLKGKYFLITDDWSWSYFHWTSDVLQKLYLLKNDVRGNTVLIPEHFKKYSYIIESLALFDVKIYFFSPQKNLKIEKLIVPSPVGGSGLFNYDIIYGLSKFIKENWQIKNIVQPDKIYISRNKANYRKILNEEEVFKILKDLGFIILYTENLSLIEQVQTLSKCRWLVSIHGGGLTNELYLPESSNVLEIRHPKDHLNNCYYLLATALNLNYYYFLGCADKDDTHAADISVNISLFEKCMKGFLLI